MTLLKITNFPNVCRLCMKAKSPSNLLSTKNYKDENGVKLIDLLDDITFPIPEHLRDHVPDHVCTVCYQIFEFVYKYKQKINLLLHFMVAFSEVKFGDQETLIELFQTDKDNLLRVFKDMNICDEDDINVQQILSEYDEYEAEAPIIKHDPDESSNEDYQRLIEIMPQEEVIIQENTMTEFLDPEPMVKRVKVVGVEKSERQLELAYEVVQIQQEGDENMIEDEEYEPIYEEFSDNENVTTYVPKKVYKRMNTVRGKIRSDTLLMCTHDKCKFKTFYKDSLDRHVERHSQIWKCEVAGCDAICMSRSELTAHKSDLHSQYICDICGMAMKHKTSLATHYKRHTGEAEFQCKYCPKVYYTGTELKLHTTSTHTVQDQQFECGICGLSFKAKKHLQTHERTHSDERNFKCDQCSMAFKDMAHLRRHIDGVHKAIKFQCEYCPQTYGRRDKLRMHLEKAHSIQAYFNCDICLKSFMTNEKLMEHKNFHENPKELECAICLVACSSQEQFDEHLCITYRNDYICCNRDHKYHVYYNKHMFLAHGIKVNARVKPKDNMLTGCARAQRKHVERCPKCDMTFGTSRKMKKEHMATCCMDDEQTVTIITLQE